MVEPFLPAQGSVVVTPVEVKPEPAPGLEPGEVLELSIVPLPEPTAPPPHETLQDE